MFSRIGNLIYRSSESKNSASYVNRQSLNLTLDPSGTDFVEYSTNSAYFTDAHSLIPNSDSQTTTTALKLQDSSTPANNFFLSTLLPSVNASASRMDLEFSTVENRPTTMVDFGNGSPDKRTDTEWPQNPVGWCPEGRHSGKQRKFFRPPRLLFRK